MPSFSADYTSFAYQDCRRAHLKNTRCTKTLGGRGLNPAPQWRNLQHSIRPLSWWVGGLPLCKIPTPASHSGFEVALPRNVDSVPTPLIFTSSIHSSTDSDTDNPVISWKEKRIIWLSLIWFAGWSCNSEWSINTVNFAKMNQIDAEHSIISTALLWRYFLPSIYTGARNFDCDVLCAKSAIVNHGAFQLNSV